MKELNTYLSTAPSLTSVKDAQIRELIKEYLLLNKKDIFIIKYGTVTTYLYMLTRTFKDISLNEVNGTYVIDNQHLWNNASCAREFCKFLLFLLHKEIIRDVIISRLLYFEHRINSKKHIVKDFYISLLTDSLFEQAVHVFDTLKLNEEEIYSRYKITLSCKDFGSDVIWNVLLSEFTNLKFSLTYTNRTVISKLYAIKHVATSIFKLYNEDSFTSKVFLNHYKNDFKEQASSIYKSQFVNLTITLSRLRIINDVCLQKFSDLYCSHQHNMESDTIIKILESQTIDNWLGFEHTDFRSIERVSWIELQCKDVKKRDIIIRALSNYLDPKQDNIFTIWKEFDNSFGDPYRPFSFTSYKDQLLYFANTDEQQNAARILTKLYQFIGEQYDNELFLKEGIPLSILHRNHLGHELISGYDVVIHNLLNPIPKTDKWILCFPKERGNSIILSRLVDFTDIDCELYRSWSKHYLWHKHKSTYSKLQSSWPKHFFNYLYRLKTGKVLTIFSKPDNSFKRISAGEVEAYKNYVLTEYDNSESVATLLSNMRSIVKYIEENCLCVVDKGVHYNLHTSAPRKERGGYPIPEHELSALTTILKSHCEERILFTLYYSVYHLALETELRINTIVNLNKDCVKETAKKGEYVILSTTKTSHYEKIEIPITNYVKRDIDEILIITEANRQECADTSLCDYLFLIPRGRNHTFGPLQSKEFNKYLAKCCLEANVPVYTASNLRDTHMTKAEEYVIRNQLSELEQCTLSGHATSHTDTLHYVGTNIRDMLESVHGIIIGDISLDGKVLDNIDSTVARTENEVSNGCGYCSVSNCSDNTYLDCMLCNDFVTTIDRKKYFEEQVKAINHKIQYAAIMHDKEDLINIKRLLLRYIEEILCLEERIKNEKQ